jgi:hypothetical protein
MCYFAFSGIQYDINQLKKRPTLDYVIIITMVSIYNKESFGMHFPEMITLMLQAIPRGLVVLPSPIINFVEVGAKSSLWS